MTPAEAIARLSERNAIVRWLQERHADALQGARGQHFTAACDERARAEELADVLEGIERGDHLGERR